MKHRSTMVCARLLASTIITSSALLAAPAFAQGEAAAQAGAPETAAAETGNDEAIVITGSLIRNPNLVASSPVNVVGENEIDLQQANVAEELLRELPGATPSIGSAVNNGNNGSSFADLRGLGPNRNVVLLDGVRLVPSNLAGIFDLNNVPLALIQRVDVLTGGASTTYGADAVSGVVNFVTRQDFAGIDINLSEQLTEEGDGNVFRADVTIGANFDDGRGNAVLSVGYQESDAVYQGARPFSLFSLDSGSGEGSGSGTSAPTRFQIPGRGQVQVNPQGTDFNPTSAFIPFNFNPYNIFQTPFERFNIYGAARYEISEAIEIYSRGMFSKNTVSTIAAPSGAFGILAQVSLNNPLIPSAIRATFCANNDSDPRTSGIQTLTPAQCAAAATATGPTDPNYREISTSVNRRFVEGGVRLDDFTTTFFDYRLGARGGITDTINWDIFGAYGESENVRVRRGYTLNSRIRQSLLVETDGSGQVVCQDQSNGCVPVDWFGVPNNATFTPEAIDFLTENASQRVSVSLAQARATINGDFGWSIPWASNPVSFAVGGEYRQYRATQEADSLSQSGDVGGAGGAAPNIDGGFNVYEAFGELIVPIAEDRPFFDELTFEAGIRYSSYTVDAPNSPSFNTTTWKVGGSWAPIDGLRFRGNYARSVRAPNIGELFSPIATGLTNLGDDPCAVFNDQGQRIRDNPTGTLRAVCLAQGATPANVDSIPTPTAGQANATGGGSLDLEPEKATSWTVGAVFQPDFVPGLSLSIDYYHILVTDAITSPAPEDAIFACFGAPGAATQAGYAPTYNPTAGSETNPVCTQIRRDPSGGGLNADPATTPGLFLPTTNQGRLETSGVDFTANYRRDLGFVGLDLNFVLNWTEQSKFQAIAGESFNRDCVGLYSINCGSPANGGTIQPEWQWSARATFSIGDIDLSLLWRHLDSVRYEFAEETPAFRGTLPDSAGPIAGREVDFNRIPAYDYFDLTGRFAVNDNLTLTLSVQNLFDKQPPILGNSIGTTTFNSGNTFPSTYDALGRRFVASARVRF
jgi:iron complex outermembrane receptor protein